MDANTLDRNILSSVEADCFWCLTKLLDGIQVCQSFNIKFESYFSNNQNDLLNFFFRLLKDITLNDDFFFSPPLLG